MKRANDDSYDRNGHPTKRPQPSGGSSAGTYPQYAASPNLAITSSPSPTGHNSNSHVYNGCSKIEDYELIEKLGEGTFGEVHKGKHKSGKLPGFLALKRILMHNENEGLPITALREIKILRRLKHENVVGLLDIAVKSGSRTNKQRAHVYMVFPYMDHDLSGLLNNPKVRLSGPQIKLYMKQLLEGTTYMHSQKILHRDIKAANLLISNNGNLKIADFGLARPFKPPGEEYTSKVVTRWYRPPELLLGEKKYSPAVDLWGIGCVFGEMLTGRPILQGNTDQDQLEKIFKMCGSPTEETMPGYSTLPALDEKGVTFEFKHHHARRVKDDFEAFGILAADLMDKLLVLNPKERPTAFQALDHDFLWTDPLPAPIGGLPIYEPSHEYDRQRKHEAHERQHAAQQQQQQQHHMGGGYHGPSRHNGNGGGAGYRPDYDDRGDRRRDGDRNGGSRPGGGGAGGNGAPGGAGAPAPHRPIIPLPPKPAAAAVPPAPASLQGGIRRP